MKRVSLLAAVLMLGVVFSAYSAMELTHGIGGGESMPVFPENFGEMNPVYDVTPEQVEALKDFSPIYVESLEGIVVQVDASSNDIVGMKPAEIDEKYKVQGLYGDFERYRILLSRYSLTRNDPVPYCSPCRLSK